MRAPTTEDGEIYCVVCGRTRDVREYDGLSACKTHMRDVFTKCEACGEYVQSEHALMWRDSRDTMILCRKCSDRQSRRVDSPWLWWEWEAMETSHAVGVEIECINSTNKTVEQIFRTHQDQMRYFREKHDSSVTGGLELVTIPLKLKDFIKFVRKCRWMERTFRVDVSCGLHVHLNARPWFVFDGSDLEELGQFVQKLTLGFLRIEDYMFSTQPASRRFGGSKYHYTERIRDRIAGIADLSLTEMEQMSGRDFARRYFSTAVFRRINDISDIPRTKMGLRYCWANLSVVTLDNTIEVRLHSGTTSAKKIELWVRCLDKIMTHILESTLQELRSFGPESLPQILNQDEMQYLNDRIEKFTERRD